MATTPSSSSSTDPPQVCGWRHTLNDLLTPSNLSTVTISLFSGRRLFPVFAGLAVAVAVGDWLLCGEVRAITTESCRDCGVMLMPLLVDRETT